MCVALCISVHPDCGSKLRSRSPNSAMAASNPLNQINNKLKESTLSVENKEIFSLLLSFLDGILKQKDTELTEVKNNLASL